MEDTSVRRTRLAPLRIVIIYLLVGGLWILLSDTMVAAIAPDLERLTLWQTLKGWFYVIATAWMLYALIRRNIASIQRSEEALRDSEERLARIIETIPSGITILDRDGHITFANAAAERILGLDRSDITGRTYDDSHWRITTVDGKPFPEDQLPFAQVMRTGRAVYGLEHALEHPDGSRVILSVNASPLRDQSGRITGVVTALSDVTEREMAEENKREFYRRTILAATEGKLVITDRDEICKIAGLPIASWHIQSGEDLGLVRHEVAGLAKTDGMDETRIYDFILAVGEATTNALKHAGGGLASLHRKDDCLILVVSDQGPGIEALVLPEVALKRGYSTVESLGMGYKAMISVADRVYLATGPGGTTVAIEMSLHPIEAPLSPAILPDLWRT